MDISCKNDAVSFRIRSAGILIMDGKVLLQHEKSGSEYAFPGGTLKLGETTEESLAREWKEETGADIRIGKLLWIEEDFWEYKGRTNHSITFYYRIELREDMALADASAQKDNAGILFEWLPLERIKDVTLYPDFAKEAIFAPDEGVRHFVSRE